MAICSKCNLNSTAYEICLSCRGEVSTYKRKFPIKVFGTVMILVIGGYFSYGYVLERPKEALEILQDQGSKGINTTTPVAGDTISVIPQEEVGVYENPESQYQESIPDTTLEALPVLENPTKPSVTAEPVGLNRLLPKVDINFRGTYKFTLPDPVKGYIHWDACRPIEYVVNTKLAPSGSIEVLNEALARVSEASGLKFSYLGVTDERLKETRAYQQTEKYRTTTGWAPVLIVFQSDAEFDAAIKLNGYRSGNIKDVKGFATPLPAENNTINSDRGGRTYVTGVVSIRASFAEASLRDGAKETLLGIYIHELGHLLGLAHVEDDREIMYFMADNSHYGPGDLEGLAILGGQECLDTNTYPVPYNLVASFNNS
jgi:hypothetical protein